MRSLKRDLEPPLAGMAQAREAKVLPARDRDLPRVLERAHQARFGAPGVDHRQQTGSATIVRRFAALTLVACLVVGLIAQEHTRPVAAQMLYQLDRAAVAGGLGINHVAVSGHNRTRLDEIFAALRLDDEISFLRFDTPRARGRIEKLAWVDKAKMIHILPDTLAVHIVERRPFAIWQNRGMLFLVDREGKELEPVAPGDYPGLPMLVGAGAPAAAARLFNALAAHPQLAGKVIASVRVADRRWNLRMSDGLTIKLPESGLDGAIDRLARLVPPARVAAGKIVEIDLRQPNQTVVRPANAQKRQRSARREHEPAAAHRRRTNG